MPENILLERLRAETQLVVRPIEHQEARVLAGAIAICKDLPAHARQVNEDLWGIVKAREVDRFQELGEQLLDVLNKIVGALRVGIEKLNAPLRSELAEVEQLRQEHLDRWPWVRQEDFDLARTEAVRGETVEPAEALARIAGVSREEWERRVQTRQRQKANQGGI